MLQQNIDVNNFSNKAIDLLEEARSAHEKYLTGLNIDDLNNAVDMYIKALKADPAISEVYYRLACLLWKKGDISLEGAIEQCKAAVGLAPKNANAHMYMAYFFNIANETENAEKEFYEAIKLHPLNSARARVLLSQVLLEKSSVKTTELIKSLHYLLTGSIMMLWDKASLKMIYSGLKENLATLKYKFIGNFYEGLNKNQLAIKTYHEAATCTRHSAQFYHICGDLLLKEDEPEAALGAYKNALEMAPTDRDLLVKAATVTQTYFEDKTDDAIDYYTRLLKIEPENPKIYYELGHLYIQKNDRLSSINAFKLALEKDSENPFYHNSLAFALVQVEHYDEAIEHYKKAISLNPENEWTAIVCQALALIYHQIKNNLEAALAFYDMAIALDPKAVDSYIAIGDIYFDSDNLDEAIKAYCDAIKIAPDNPKVYGKAGIALWESDFLEEAIVAYSKAIKLKPDYTTAMNNLGVIYLDGIGNTKEAARLFEEALAIDPDYLLANFNLARAYQAQGNIMMAAQYYQIALDLNKNSEELDEKEIKQRIHSLFDVE